jgi:hypothetical protein
MTPVAEGSTQRENRPARAVRPPARWQHQANVIHGTCAGPIKRAAVACCTVFTSTPGANCLSARPSGPGSMTANSVRSGRRAAPRSAATSRPRQPSAFPWPCASGFPRRPSVRSSHWRYAEAVGRWERLPLSAAPVQHVDQRYPMLSAEDSPTWSPGYPPPETKRLGKLESGNRYG